MEINAGYNNRKPINIAKGKLSLGYKRSLQSYDKYSEDKK